MKLDHVYLSVKDLDRAIAFWESVLQQKVAHQNKDRWANFRDDGVYIGLYRPGYDGDSYRVGENITLVLSSDDLDQDHRRISLLSHKVSEIQEAGEAYRYFHFSDSEGNMVEVATYKPL